MPTVNGFWFVSISVTLTLFPDSECLSSLTWPRSSAVVMSDHVFLVDDCLLPPNITLCAT